MSRTPIDLDADPRNANWLRIVGRAREFGRWSRERIDAECEAPYDEYLGAVRRRHIAYFAERPDQRSATHSFAAAEREFAFPDDWRRLSGVLPEHAWHRHHLSGGSSQTLAITLLSAAQSADPSLSWLPGSETLGSPAATLFEVELAPEVLSEQPRQTCVDVLFTAPRGVIVVEAKFTERGFGVCSCTHRAGGRCSPRVLARPNWGVAQSTMGLRRGPVANGCGLSLVYQAVRNLAAARAIAGERDPSFVLAYDDRNPYFAGAGEWPGWVSVLTRLTEWSRIPVRFLSWLSLLASVDLDRGVTEWAAEKHGFEAVSA